MCINMYIHDETHTEGLAKDSQNLRSQVALRPSGVWVMNHSKESKRLWGPTSKAHVVKDLEYGT